MDNLLSKPKPKPPILIRGMWGIGDNIHQRAVLRELMKKHDVWLDACCVSMFHDLAAQGMHIVPRPHGTGAAARVRDARERGQFEGLPNVHVPPAATERRRHIGYDKHSIKAYGSILAAQFASVGLSMPSTPDFSLVVPQSWKDKALQFINRVPLEVRKKPLLVYRPIVLNKGWECPARAPDPIAYDKLFRRIKDRFYVVGVANCYPGYEWTSGPQPALDLDLTHGELDFEGMAGLFAHATMVFANPGFAPVLAQAVGTPVVIVYGGNECFADTNIVGAHLAPTLAIEPDKPCACHLRVHNCNKHITLEPALEKLETFVEDNMQLPRILIFGTMYADTKERVELTKRWVDFHHKLNPDCDLLLVDSASPALNPVEDLGISPATDSRVFTDNVGSPSLTLDRFPDNIGHLSRNGPRGPSSGGQDGWGRSFCEGLATAIEANYDYVVHIEGDSLFRLPVLPIVRQMVRDGIKAISVPVNGTKRNEVNWVETGLMLFNVDFVEQSEFIPKYGWNRNKGRSGTPEHWIFNQLGSNLKMMPWKALRGDKNQITAENVDELDWVTHCRIPGSQALDDLAIYDRFITAALSGEADVKSRNRNMIKVNLGCGKNILPGWDNHDKDIDITKKLPFADSSIDRIFAEHVVEHVEYYAAIKFFEDCYRVLKPGGIIRITIPSIENVMRRADQEYVRFVSKWVPHRAGTRAGMYNILFCHGHRAAWTDSLLEASLFYAGFNNLIRCESGKSENEEMRGLEGHGKVIGEHMNWIESMTWEGTVEK